MLWRMAVKKYKVKGIALDVLYKKGRYFLLKKWN